MDIRKLGKSDIEVSVVGLGCNNFGRRIHDVAAARAVVHRALDLGVTLFDTADAYGNGTSESFLGETLGARRKQVVIATKFGVGSPGGASRRTIMQTVEASLKRLRTDYIDLYQVHFPDTRTPIEETLRALDELVRQGKVRQIGCSNFSRAQVTAALDASKRLGIAAFVTCQDEYSLLVRGIEARLVTADARARHDAPALRAARRRLSQRQIPPRQAAAQERAAGLQRASCLRRHQRAELDAGGSVAGFCGAQRP